MFINFAAAMAISKFDFVVVGGGIFGCYAALYLAGRGAKVALLEKEARLFQKASLVNQARLHSGYHYPRSIATAALSDEHKARFTAEHRDFVHSSFEKYYAIDRFGSFTDPRQFERFCARLGIRCERVEEHNLFNFNRLEALYRTEEHSFDPILLGNFYRQKVENTAGITLFTQTTIARAEASGADWEIECAMREFGVRSSEFGVQSSEFGVRSSEFEGQVSNAGFPNSQTPNSELSNSQTPNSELSNSKLQTPNFQTPNSELPNSKLRTFKLQTPAVINATYAATNGVNRVFGLGDLALMHEISEIAFVASPQFGDRGLTVMDGPFGSIMPYGRSGLLSLSSVAYTHHKISYDNLPRFDCQRLEDPACRPDAPGICTDCARRPPSNARKMLAQMQQYFAENVDFQYLFSYFTIKSKLKASHIDDGRPTEIACLRRAPHFYCLFAGKINSIYEVEKFV